MRSSHRPAWSKQIELRRHFPLMRVNYVRVEERDWVPDAEERYEGAETIGPLLTPIPRGRTRPRRYPKSLFAPGG